MSSEHTAVHEAGHAVIGRVLGVPCGLATIVCDQRDGSAGHNVIPEPYAIEGHWENCEIWHRESRVAFRARIMTYMAGAEAENGLLGGCSGGVGDDQEQIDSMSGESLKPSEEWEQLERRLRRYTACLVRKHCDKIRLVADELMKRHTLQSDQIDALVPETETANNRQALSSPDGAGA